MLSKMKQLKLQWISVYLYSSYFQRAPDTAKVSVDIDESVSASSYSKTRQIVKNAITLFFLSQLLKYGSTCTGQTFNQFVWFIVALEIIENIRLNFIHLLYIF